MRPDAWVTSAVRKEDVNKALILAGSLKRVKTSKLLAVLTTFSVPEELREKLKDEFDLVVPFDGKTCNNGFALEDHAKVEAISLSVFNKCVYLSPNTLVLKNCDEVFGKYSDFAAARTGPNDNCMDTSVFVYTPNMGNYHGLKKVASYRELAGDFPRVFNAWLENHVANIDTLHEEYNSKLSLQGKPRKILTSNASIINFNDAHPIDIGDILSGNAGSDMGTLEKLAVDHCWTIYMEDVKQASIDSAWLNHMPPYKSEPIAIVGLSFRLPGGNNVDDFWSLLAEGKNAVVPLPSHRWKTAHSCFHAKNRKVEAGFLDVAIDEFDAKFFALSPKEAEFLDPQQRLLLEVAWEALEDAMIDPLKLKGTQTGIFVGSWLYEYRDMLIHSPDVDFFRTYLGNSIASSTARLSHFLETTGPSIATESACSSAIAAVDLACKSLRLGTSDVAVAAGVNLLLHPFDSSSLEYIVSPDFRCKTFDANANGFARGEGCAVLLLKRFSDAVKDGDNIWGLVRGTALTQEGVSKSLGTPTVHCESMAMELALKDAGVHPKDVSYVEAHGTGTSVGDPMEILAINKAYSAGRTEPLLIGSVKTNVGHTESVSGITGIIKVLLSMKNELIPKHLNLNTLNPNINLAEIPAQIPLTPVPWPRSNDKLRIAGVSSFGISGTDGHAIIEEPPVIHQPRLDFQLERPLHIMTISAKSEESLEQLIQKYEKICSEGGDGDFADLAYSANTGRALFDHRAVIVAKDFAGAAKILGGRSFQQRVVQTATSKLCFLFTGQGSQYSNMAKQLYETSPIFRDYFDVCDVVLKEKYNISIKNTMWPSTENAEDLSRTLYSQTSIFVVEYCLLKLWESWGVKPDFVMGHSLGEFAAAVAAGSLDFEDALMLVAERSRLIDSLPRGKMLVIKCDKKTTDEVITAFQRINPDFWVDYAAINSPEQTVVAGDPDMIDNFSKFCEKRSLKSVVLSTTHAFHSRHMHPILESFKKIAKTAKKSQLRRSQDYPQYISGMEGKLVNLDSINDDYWVKHTRERVNFMDACRTAQQEGCTMFLEVGPHPVLSALTLMNNNGHQVTCLPSLRRNENEWVTLLESLTKLHLSDWKGEIDWKGFDRFYRRNKVKLPFYPFNRKSVWAKIEASYPKIHPLIGSIMPTASGETIFQNSLTLSNSNFVQDHVIGNFVVFPGAGYLEMCLVGGHLAGQGFTEDIPKPRRPIGIKCLKIPAPLALHESETCKLQTVIALNNNTDDSELSYSVGVHRLAKDEWIQHASTKFLPVVQSVPKLLCEPIDISKIQSTCEKSTFKEFYEKLPSVGLRFGPKFQSLEYGWKSEAGILASVKVPVDHRDYLIHPTVADAMIQAIMMWTSKKKIVKKLQVPVQISEFLWLNAAKSSKQFVYCCSSENVNDQVYCLLVDEDGSILACMKGVEFVETTVKLVEGMITQQSNAMPKLWRDVWKNVRGPMQGYLTHEATPEEQNYSEEDLKLLQENNNIGENELKYYKNTVKLTRLSIMKVLYTLGWNPKMADVFTLKDLIAELRIQENFTQYIRFFLRSMTKEDCRILKAEDEDENSFRFVIEPPSKDEIEAEFKAIFSKEDMKRDEYRLIMEIEKHLSKIFRGQQDTLSILFPSDSNNPSAEKYYAKNISAMMPINAIEAKVKKHVTLATQVYASSPKACRPTYRVLEVGGGTGTLTKIFLEKAFPQQSIIDCNLEYYFTDVTAAFFDSAKKAFDKHLNSVVFKRFDMDKDPLEQGLCPGYFDMITGYEVFHIAKDIKKTIKSVRALLKPGGLVLIGETIYPDERITYIFGLLDGYWQFEDMDFRRNHTTLTPEMWEETLSEAGFHGITVTSMYNNIHGLIGAYAKPVENAFLVNLEPRRSSWIIFGEIEDKFTTELFKKISDVNRKCLVVSRPKHSNYTEVGLEECFKTAFASALENADRIEGIIYLWSLSPNSRDQRQVSLPFVTMTKLLSDIKVKVFAVMRGTCTVDSSYVIDPTSGTLVGFCKSLANENINLNVTFLDLDPNKNSLSQVEELFMNLWVEHKQGAAFRDGLRLCPKLAAAKTSENEPLSLPSGCDRFQLLLPQTRSISDLEFAYLEPHQIGEDEVEIQVKAMALNFRDVFAILKPIPVFEKFNTVGLDYSGVVNKVGRNVTKFRIGDRVIGMNMDDNGFSLPSHMKATENMIIRLQDGMTFGEGVTLPAVFFTALHCLINIAKMKMGETVLIHTASGGVGLVAIQLCNQIGAKVIATAGSQRKRTYLRNLGIEHVFHSRTTDFKDEILKVTARKGVDIVLNSITGPGFKEASLDVLRENGRFIEMSKLNVWTKEEVSLLRPDVFYEIVDLTSLDRSDHENLLGQLKKYMDTGAIRPIPYERFDALNIRGALNYLQKAKHIGKIVCIMPEVKLKKSKFIASTPLFNEGSTYLVTGGLGGIGYAVVKWMLSNGAKHIAIVSRSSPKPEVVSQIEAWNGKGYHVKAFQVDVGDYEKCKMLFQELKKKRELGFPPLRGVMHAAGVLRDAVLENQSWEHFLETYNPKVNGSWNLHDLTKECLLEHFVLFSSIAATFGSPGQTNHSASNAFEDSLAAYRRSIGLPATCVNWGNWGEVGVATELDFPGIRPISTLQGFLALETFLRTQTSHMSVLNVDSFSQVLKLYPKVKHYIDDCRLLGDQKTSMIINSDEFWNEVNSTETREEKLACFKKFIKTVVRNTLKMDQEETIADQTEFQTLGIDSLMMLEMKNGLQNILGTRMTLTASQLKDCNNTDVLANTLVNILDGDSDHDKNEKLPSREELKQLIREDSSLLPESLCIENLKITSIDQIETVLLTGATGNLGPYLLSELTRREQVNKVYCLIRPTNKMQGMKRLKTRLEQMDLAEQIDFAKVEVVDGDITSSNFGLNEETYCKLCEKVDAIVHSAVKSDHFASYWKAPETRKSHIRTVNVLGTLHLLEFAAKRKLKHFYHASTMIAFTGMGEDGNFSEGWQAVSAFDELQVIGNFGYVISKHISEQLVHRAILKGIPCKAFRFPVISGESKTGRLDYHQNHVILRWLACMKIQAIHDLPVPLFTVAADHCARISLDIFLSPEAPMDVYNIVQKSVEVEQVLVEVVKNFGIELQIISYEQFIEKLKSIGENSPLSNFINLYVEKEMEFLATYENPSIQVLRKYWEDGVNFLDTSKLTKYAPDYDSLMESAGEVMNRDFTYLWKEGVFDKYGIATL